MSLSHDCIEEPWACIVCCLGWWEVIRRRWLELVFCRWRNAEHTRLNFQCTFTRGTVSSDIHTSLFKHSVTCYLLGGCRESRRAAQLADSVQDKRPNTDPSETRFIQFKLAPYAPRVVHCFHCPRLPRRCGRSRDIGTLRLASPFLLSLRFCLQTLAAL